MKTHNITYETRTALTDLLADSLRLIEALDARRETPTNDPQFKTRVDAVWRAHATARDTFARHGMIQRKEKT